jgi:hypothetical protein
MVHRAAEYAHITSQQRCNVHFGVKLN